MQEINCPYTWFCGEKFEPHEMSEHDHDFLKSAIANKMTFMFVDCPKCATQFQFNPVKWEAIAMFSGPSEETVKNIKPVKELLTSLEKSNIEIPHAYLDYLADEKFNSEISIFQGQNKFHLYKLEELCETININGISCLRITELEAYARSLNEIFGEKNSEEFPFSELSNCLTIGYENESVLFLDHRDKNSLWIFYPDGGDIKPTKMTLDKITNKSKC